MRLRERLQSPRFRALRRLALAAFVALSLAAISAFGVSPLPPLGPAFNPGTGIWTSAADARLPQTGVLHIPGLQSRASITFERNGTAHVQAANDHDLFFATGYLHARFRLAQMDLQRRQGEGRLAQIAGYAALDLDRFELRLGLERTARQEWAATRGEERAALLAYSAGVNARIDEDNRDRTVPFLFHLLGYRPTRWTPVDTLVIQGDIVQTLDLTSAPLDYALLVHSLGLQRTERWFPVLPANEQYPYDPGPYQRAASRPLPAQLGLSGAALRSIAAVRRQMAALGVLSSGGNSNNWAISGARTVSGKPLMAGDPHLQQTLPAIWYELSQDSPHFHVSGVSVPGTPIVIIGRNRHISWSPTNTQNQATLFYVERTARTHPHQYFWHGAWRTMQRISYTIPIKGGSSERFTVDLTVHGPVIDDDRAQGKTISMYWVGALPSDDLGALFGIARASSFSQFRAALRPWHAPTQNFVYADDANNIGMIAPGYYPLVRRGSPWLPLPGTGESDVVGTIPYNAVPQAYDPPGHVLFSANQRPVGAGYPYYIGTSLDFFDNGFRADRIDEMLSGKRKLSVADMERMQGDTHDYLWERLKGSVRNALRSEGASAPWVDALLHWNGAMEANSVGATIWWTFLSRYVHDTFDPWWKRYHVPSGKFDPLRVGPDQAPLVEDIEAWTLHDPANATFSLPNGRKRTARDVMIQAMHEAIARLDKRLGRDVRHWQWGRLHTRVFPSLAQVSALGYGPRPAGGDLWTVDAASGEFQADTGPSWRMIVDWGSGTAQGVYPGGQSENPASPWYTNEIGRWWSGNYNPLLDAAAARREKGIVVWSLTP